MWICQIKMLKWRLSSIQIVNTLETLINLLLYLLTKCLNYRCAVRKRSINSLKLWKLIVKITKTLFRTRWRQCQVARSRLMTSSFLGSNDRSSPLTSPCMTANEPDLVTNLRHLHFCSPDKSSTSFQKILPHLPT